MFLDNVSSASGRNKKQSSKCVNTRPTVFEYCNNEDKFASFRSDDEGYDLFIQMYVL